MAKSKAATGVLRAVSLFSNCGAGDVGYQRAGFQFEVMAELEPKRLDVCLLNHPYADGIPGDLRETWPDVVKRYRKRCGRKPLHLLAACPPCQGMSSARGLRGTHEDADAGSKDERNLLAVVIAKVAEKLKPQIIVVENVPEFLVRKIRHPESGEGIPASRLLVELLSNDYYVFPALLDMCDFGVPQTRKRTFLTFIRRGLPGLEILKREGWTPYPKPHDTPKISVSEALRARNLPQLDAASAATAGNGMHQVPVWAPDRYRMIAAIPANSGRSAWKNNTCHLCGCVEHAQEDIRCKSCGTLLMKPTITSSDGQVRLIRGFHSSYKRMHPDQPAATILTASGHVGSHNTIHPFENRVLSTLECSILQTLGENFKWGSALEKWGHTNVRAMIGEAVPPHFTEQHGRILRSILDLTLGYPHLESNHWISKEATKKLFH